MKRVKILLVAIILLGISSYGAATEKIVATVNGEAITSFDLDQAMKTFGTEIQKESKLTGTSLRAKVLEKLIDEKVLELEMKKGKDRPDLKVLPHEVDAQIDRILKGNRMSPEMFEQELSKRGITLEQYKEKLEEQLQRNKFVSNNIGRKIDISEREIKAYFDKHADEFKSVSAVQLSQINIPFTQNITSNNLDEVEKLAVEIVNAAKTSSDFASLAKKFSGKYVVQGGSLGVVKLQDLQPQIAQAAAEMQVGQTSGPIITGNGIHIIKVTGKSETGAKDFVSVRDQVSDVLYQMKMQSLMENYVRELRRKAEIEIKSLGSSQ